MSKYAFPAVFTPEKTGYSVFFPDVEGCYTQGDTLPEAIEMAEDVLALMLCHCEDTGSELKSPSDIKSIPVSENQITTLVYCDTSEYRRLYLSKSVKKTLSIPAWLNTLAEKDGINFSAVLQNALKKELNIE